MSKLALILALLGNAVAVVALLQRPSAPSPSSAALPGGSLSDEDVRRLREEFERAVRSRDEGVYRELAQRLEQLSTLRAGWTQSFQQAQKAAEGVARENAGKLEELDDRVRALNDDLGKQVQASVALETRLKDQLAGAVKDLSAELARRPAGAGPAAPSPGPSPPPVEPVPQGPAEDPAVVKAAIEKALADLDQGDEENLYAAIVVVQKYRVMEAVPRLLKILGPTSKSEYFTRVAAVAALGEMKSCDAVVTLAEALTDKSELVAQQANKAIREITGFDTGMDPRARIPERRRARDAVMEFWGRHEDEVRARLGQPKAPPR